MGFTQSIINQIGRDTGRVISNQIFKGAHATPVKMIRENQSNQKSQKVRDIKTEFEKSIDFQMGVKPSTLVNKLSGAQIVLKNEIKKFLSDGYLDMDESDVLFKMINQFNDKANDVYDILRIDETKNESEIKLIDKIMLQVLQIFCDALDVTIKGCTSKSLEFSEKAKNEVKPMLFGRKDYEKKVANYNLISELENKRIEIYTTLRDSNKKTLEENSN